MTDTLLIQIALAAGAGLLVNLTPCVLPALALKVRAVLNEASSTLAVRTLSAALLLAGSVLFLRRLAWPPPCCSGSGACCFSRAHC